MNTSLLYASRSRRSFVKTKMISIVSWETRMWISNSLPDNEDVADIDLKIIFYVVDPFFVTCITVLFDNSSSFIIQLKKMFIRQRVTHTTRDEVNLKTQTVTRWVSPLWLQNLSSSESYPLAHFFRDDFQGDWNIRPNSVVYCPRRLFFFLRRIFSFRTLTLLLGHLFFICFSFTFLFSYRSQSTTEKMSLTRDLVLSDFISFLFE